MQIAMNELHPMNFVAMTIKYIAIKLQHTNKLI